MSSSATSSASQTRSREGGLRTRKLVKRSLPRRPLISVITVVYNDEKHVEQAIQSVFNQTYNNFEYILVDGGSTDRTIDIIKQHGDAFDYWVSEPDCGVYDAMNKGIRLAYGDLIVLLNSDDYFPTYSLEKVAERFNATPCQEAIYYGDAYVVYEDLKAQALRKAHLDFKKCMGLIHQAMFVTKDVYQRNGLYDLRYRNAADYDFSIRMFINKIPYIYIEEPLVFSRRRQDRISEKFAKQSIAEENAILTSHYGAIGKLYFFRNYFFSKLREIIHKTIVKLMGERFWIWIKRSLIIRIRP